MPDTRRRSTADEIMDDFSLEGEELRDALDKIARINQLLGGNRLTLNSVRKLLSNTCADPLKIIDVGCGNGDMLRTLADYGRRNKLVLNLIGIDANSFTIAHAKNMSAGYPEISYLCIDVFEPDFANITYEIVLCTLTLHHFSDSEIIKLMRIFSKNARLGVVINDLHRSKMAYHLFQILCLFFGLNRMSRQDGLVSILRGFKKNELLNYSAQLGLKSFTIRWRWAFRYEWIIKTI